MDEAELSEKINEILGTEIDFTKLTKDDLETLHRTITDRRFLARALRNATVDDLINIVRERAKKGGGFFIGILDRFLGKEER